MRTAGRDVNGQISANILYDTQSSFGDMLWWCLEVVVVGPEACFEWLGAAASSSGAVTNFKLVSAVGLVIDHEDHSKTITLQKHSGFDNESKANAMTASLTPCLYASCGDRCTGNSHHSSRADSTIMIQRLCMRVTFGLAQDSSLQPS